MCVFVCGTPFDVFLADAPLCAVLHCADVFFSFLFLTAHWLDFDKAATCRWSGFVFFGGRGKLANINLVLPKTKKRALSDQQRPRVHHLTTLPQENV